MVDFLDFSSEIQVIKEKMMKKLGVKRRNFFVFQYRGGNFAGKEGKGLRVGLKMGRGLG